MSNETKLYYKTCRERAGLTQEQAITLLGISEVATLSRYENGHVPVSQDMVALMAKVYHNRTLVWWYLRHVNPELAEFLPEPPPMTTDGDMMLRLELGVDDLSEMRNMLKTIFRNGVIDCEQADKFKVKASTFRHVASVFMEIAGYLDGKQCNDCQ
jgi:transcriptional regulator with XRE-family HTH domain